VLRNGADTAEDEANWFAHARKLHPPAGTPPVTEAQVQRARFEAALAERLRELRPVLGDDGVLRPAWLERRRRDRGR